MVYPRITHEGEEMAPRFSHVSGSPVLDLVNTIHWRLDPARRFDELKTYTDVLDWCAESLLIAGAELRALREQVKTYPPHEVASEHASVISARESLYGALFEDRADALAHLAALHRDAIAGAALRKDGDTFLWSDLDLTLATPRHRIVRGLVDLLTRNELTRLHQCEDRACGWVFLDTSPRRNRRWCVAADCGDRNRARAYYARNRAAPAL